LLDVKLTGEAAESLKMKKRFSSSKICIPTHWVQAVGHVITINRSVAELELLKKLSNAKSKINCQKRLNQSDFNDCSHIDASFGKISTICKSNLLLFVYDAHANSKPLSFSFFGLAYFCNTINSLTNANPF